MADAHQAFAAEEAELRAVIAAGTPAERPAKALVRPSADDLERLVLEFKHKELDGQGRYRDAWRDTCESAATPKSSWTSYFDSSDTPVASTAKTRSTFTRTSLRALLLDSEGRAVTDREQLLKSLQSDLGQRSYVRVKGHIQRLIAARGWDVPEDSDQYRLLANGMLKAWVQVADNAVRRDRGIYEDVPPIGPLQPTYVTAAAVSGQPSANDQRAKRNGEGIRDYFDLYCREQKAGVTTNAIKDLRATIRAFVELNGDRPITSYTKDHMRAFKRALKDCPRNAAKLYPSKKLPEVLRLAREDGNPKLSVASINNKLSMMSKFGQWLEENVAGVQADSFKTTLLARTKRESMPPFNTRASPPHCTMPSTALVARQRLSLPAPPVSSLHTIRLSSLCDAPKCVLSRASNLEIPRNDCTSHESLDEITQRKSQSET